MGVLGSSLVGLWGGFWARVWWGFGVFRARPFVSTCWCLERLHVGVFFGRGGVGRGA